MRIFLLRTSSPEFMGSLKQAETRRHRFESESESLSLCLFLLKLNSFSADREPESVEKGSVGKKACNFAHF